MEAPTPLRGAGAFFVPQPEVGHVAEGEAGGAGDKTYTQEELDARVAEANAALEQHRDKVMDELKTVKAKLKGFDGVDPTEYHQLREQVAELTQQAKADKAGLRGEELEKLRQDVADSVLKRYASDPAAGLEAFEWAREMAAENRSLKLDTKVKAMMAKGGARAERIDALFTLTAGRFDLTEDGQPVLKANPGVQISEYVADELKAEYPEFYNGTGSSGGGASKSNAGGGGVKRIAIDDQAAFMANLEGVVSGDVQVTR